LPLGTPITNSKPLRSGQSVAFRARAARSQRRGSEGWSRAL